MDDTWRGRGLFDHGFLTGQIPESLVTRLCGDDGLADAPPPGETSLEEHLPESATRLLFAAELELNAALATLEDADLTTFDIARSKIRTALYVLDIAAENLTAVRSTPVREDQIDAQ